MKTNFKWHLNVVLLFLGILTLVITVTINSRWLYSIDVGYLNILDNVPLSKIVLMKNYDELMRYLNFFWISSLSMSDFPSSTSGLFHFEQVKNLFQLNYGVLLVTLIPNILFLRKLVKEKLFWRLIRPFQIILGGFVALVMMMLVAFDQFFVMFHQLFFNNNDWIFNPSEDPIILALPETYFLHCFLLFFVLLIGTCLLIIFLGKKSLKQSI